MNEKIRINYFQRKPRKGFNFSLEFIFDDIRKRLSDKIDARVYISKCFNDGYYSKFINIVEAAFRQNRDVNHITGETHFLNLLMKKDRTVLTVLDCGMVSRKSGWAKKIVKWLYLTAPVKRAKVVTAISEVTKNEIVAYTNANPDKIRVIPVAVSPRYQPSRKEFNNEKPVMLHIGTGPNKNLLRLVEALRGINCHLTIIGKLSEGYLTSLAENKIDYTNEYNISDERMLEKYQECDILSFISTFEGFGMPIVEANAVERVVITSNISSMPEVAGDAAYLVDPFDIEDIRAGIIKIINDKNLRRKLVENGQINKLRFDADKIANMYLEVYKCIV